jgi:hypothetical protein
MDSRTCTYSTVVLFEQPKVPSKHLVQSDNIPCIPQPPKNVQLLKALMSHSRDFLDVDRMKV